ASGGRVQAISVLDSTSGETEHDWPQLLPGGREALVQIWSSNIGDTQLGVLDLATGRATPLIQNAVYGRYVPTGHIVYVTLDGTLLVVPFEPGQSALSEAATAVAEGVQVDVISGAAQFAISDRGTLIYLPGGGVGSQQVSWVDRAGRVTPVDSAWRGNFINVALSPDNARLAVSAPAADGEQTWIKQLPSGPLTRLTFGGSTNTRPAWTPDGRRIAFVSSRSGRRQAWIQRADGGAEPESLLASPAQVDEIAWAPDGRNAVFRLGSGGVNGNRNLFAMAPGIDTVPRPLVVTRFEEYSPAVSPDGRWFAYVSNESGRSEVYVRAFDDPGAGKIQVSVDGADEPRWAHNGRELFLRSRRGEMLVADVTLGGAFSARTPRVLFNVSSMASDTYHSSYDVTRDDQRFVMISRTVNDAGELVVVLNWFTELRALSAGAR
ncbi:MAG TPA: hypothetical protein VFX50_13785, partial [Gemmatimonadales bacterium]|nr:hypothetical protein [Gemmatimonadales bacterium]